MGFGQGRLRRDFDQVEAGAGRVVFAVHHDEDVEIFINGVPGGPVNGYLFTVLDLAPTAARAARQGGLLAVRCRQQTGGAVRDVASTACGKPSAEASGSQAFAR
ncbi:MAG: hypothetical protein U1F77_18825 [Kiritimatiellia bacterium]